jgi:RNA polymerase sigma-70 factor (ECF subfamily)
MSNLNFLINCCRNGDARQQKILYEQYYAYALSVALNYMHQYDEARFIVNDSFIKFFRSINRFVCVNNTETEPQLMAWLKKIVVNTAIDKLRNKGKPFESMVDSSAEVCYSDPPLLYKELMHQVKTLPKAYRAVFHMHVIYGFKHTEIAEQLDISVGTSKSNLSKAKNYLRKLIKAEADFPLS